MINVDRRDILKFDQMKRKKGNAKERIMEEKYTSNVIYTMKRHKLKLSIRVFNDLVALKIRLYVEFLNFTM